MGRGAFGMMRCRGSIVIQVNRILPRPSKVVVRSLSIACRHLDSNFMTSSVSWKPHDIARMDLLHGYLFGGGSESKATSISRLATIRIRWCIVLRRVGCNAGAILGSEVPLKVCVHLRETKHHSFPPLCA